MRFGWITFACLSLCFLTQTAWSENNSLLVSARQVDLRNKIETDAFQALSKIDRIDTKAQLFNDLINKALKAGDVNFARKSLAYERDLSFGDDTFADVHVNQIASQSAHVGDTQAGMAFIQRAPLKIQPMAYADMGKALAEEGNLAAAREIVGKIEFVANDYAKTPEGSRVVGNDNSSGLKVFETTRDEAYFIIGQALAKNGDSADASALAPKMSNDLSLLNILGAIAQAQHQAGDNDACSKTLASIKALKGLDDPNHFVLMRSASIFALAGDLDSAQTIIKSMPVKAAQEVSYSNIARALAESGDIASAQKMATAGGDDIDALIAIAKAQVAKGDQLQARKTLITAYDSVLHSGEPNKFEKDRMVYAIISAQIQDGAFLDVLTTAKYIDPENRQQFLTSDVAVEANAHDGAALDKTIPVAIQTAADSVSQGFTSNGLLGMAEDLAKEGYRDRAEAVLSELQSVADKSSLMRPERIRLIAHARLVIGQGISTQDTPQKNLQDSSASSASSDLTAAAKDSNDPQRAAAATLVDKAETQSEPQAKETLLEALKVLGNRGAELEELIFSPHSATKDQMSTIDDLILAGYFSEAEKETRTMSGIARDALWNRLALAELKAGNGDMALKSANEISDAFQRSQTLIRMMAELAGSEK